MKETVTIKEVAERLGMKPQSVRIRMQLGLLPFGTVIKSIGGKAYRYIILRKEFEQFIGNEKWRK